MKTKKEIIDETVAYYAEDPSRRAYNHVNRACCYRDKRGQMCAVGRCIDPNAERAREAYDEAGGADYFVEQFGQEIFKEEYQGHEKDFWNDLQNFHDIKNHFNEKGLSALGRSVAMKLHLDWDNE